MESTVHPHRVKLAYVDAQTLAAMFTPDQNGAIFCIQGFPPDAKIVSITTDFLRPNTLALHVESETFEPVEEGAMMPLLPLTYHIHYMREDGSVV